MAGTTKMKRAIRPHIESLMLGMRDSWANTAGNVEERRGPLYARHGPLSTKFRLTIHNFGSAWDGVVRAGDADPVIGEVGVHAGEFDFGHVTGHALFGAHRAGVGGAARGFRVGWFG